MSSEDLEKYETEQELALYREYRDVVSLFSHVVETERRFYLCNSVDMKAVSYTHLDVYKRQPKACAAPVCSPRSAAKSCSSPTRAATPGMRSSLSVWLSSCATAHPWAGSPGWTSALVRTAFG